MIKETINFEKLYFIYLLICKFLTKKTFTISEKFQIIFFWREKVLGRIILKLNEKH